MKNKDFAIMMIILTLGAILLCLSGNDSPEMW
jgi:hypothetical protein